MQALIRQGADVNEVCNDNGDRPLHQAILTLGVGPRVIEALVGAGGDVLALNRRQRRRRAPARGASRRRSAYGGRRLFGSAAGSGASRITP